MDRRQFIKTTSLFIAGISFGSLFKKAAAVAADKKECTKADAVANALGYVSNAKDSDTKKYPQFKKLAKDHTCEGCELYKNAKGGFGDCTMLTNCTVAGKGLCGSWQKKLKKA